VEHTLLLAEQNWNDQVKDDEMQGKARLAARIFENRNAYRTLVGKPEGKRPLGRPRRRWVDNVKIDLREIKWVGMDWIDLAQYRDQRRPLVNTVMNPRVREMLGSS
jgi:hypothetical protein